MGVNLGFLRTLLWGLTLAELTGCLKNVFSVRLYLNRAILNTNKNQQFLMTFGDSALIAMG